MGKQLERVDLLFLLAENAINFHSELLCFPQPPKQKAVYEAIANPQPGQLVVERTGFFLPARAMNRGERDKALYDLERRIGWVVEFGKDELGGQTVLLDALCGTQIKWENCQFLRIFEGSTFRIGDVSSDDKQGDE